MAQGIVSANDTVAIWHTAAPSTSEPPPGAGTGPAHQNVIIPNTNKFKTPANGLQKLLQNTTHPSMGYSPASTKKVEDWLNAHPAFTKPYFKPGYAPALKAHLGEENYAKLMHHAPTPFTDLLTHHQQQPAPNSNKFKTPANGLKKLLESNPSQEQVKGWIDAHPAFHTYLGPEYEQALKSHLGEVNHAKLKAHTQGPSPVEKPPLGVAPKATPEKKPFNANDIATDLAKVPGGLHNMQSHWNDANSIQTQIKHLLDTEALGDKGSANHDALQAVYDKHFGQHGPQTTLTDKLNKAMPGGGWYPDTWNGPGAQKKLKQLISEVPSGGAKGYVKGVTKEKLQAIHDEHFGVEKSPAPEQAVSPQSPAGPVENSAEFEDAKAKALHPNNGYPDEVQKTYQDDPAFHEWFHSHTKADQASLSAAPGSTYIKFNKWKAKHPDAGQQAPSSDDAQEADAIKQKMAPSTDELSQSISGDPWATPKAAPPPGVDKSTLQHPALLQQIKKVFPNAHGDLDNKSDDELKAQLESWLKYLPEHKGPQTFDAHVPQLQKIYDQWFGNKGQQQALDPQSPGGVTPAESKVPTFEELKEVFPALTPKIFKNLYELDGDPAKVKANMEKSLQGAFGGASSKAKFQALYDKYFGGQPPQGNSELPPPSTGANLGDLLHAADPGFHAGNWNNFVKNKPADEVKTSLKKSIDFKKNKPELQKKLQDIYDSYFGTDTDADADKALSEIEPADLGYGDEAYSSAGMSYEDALKLVKEKYPYFDEDTSVKDLPSLKKKLQDWKNGLAGQVNTKDATDFLNQIGDSEQAPSPVLHLPSIVKEIAAVHGMNPHNINSHGKKLIDMDQQTLADTIKGYATSDAIDDEKKAKYQAIYDKYFGKGQVQLSDSTPALAKFVPHTFNQEYKKVFPNATFQAGNELAAKSQMEYLLKTDISGGKGKAAEVQALYDKYWGTGQHSEPATSGGFDGSSDGYDGPTLAWVKKHYPGTSLAKGNDEAKIKDWWQHGQASSVGQAWLTDAHGDKAQFQGGSPGGFTAPKPPPVYDPAKFAEEYNAIVPGSGSSVATGTASAEKALNKITQLINDHPGTPATDKLIELKNKWFPAQTPGGSGGAIPIGGTATQSVGELVKALKPDMLPTAEQIDDKLKNSTPTQAKALFDNTIEQHPELAESLKKIYDAHFGGSEKYPPPEWIKKHYKLDWTPEKVKESFDKYPTGAITTAWKDDLHSDKGEFLSKSQVHSLTPQTSPEESEEDEGVSAPFKSEKATKSDVVNWQSAKPADAADWKSFANWWGKTKLSPAQESAIYHSWFPNKAVTPEQAGSWFKKVYDFHSKPGSGDLGQPDMPAWATSTWAFGSKAAKEWPTFKVWANSSPGLPENLSIKQKLAVWNNLSAGDKKEIEDNYVPKKPVDTKAVVAALQKAYPESDWSTWATMPQGTLKNNVEVLAKQGYKGAIPVFNSVFDGKVPMPPDDDEDEEAPKALPQAPQVPPDKLPGWWKDNYGSTPDQAQKFSGLAHFMKLMGPQYAKAAETGEPPVEPDGSAPKSMYVFQQAWNNTPPAIQAQIGAMNTKVPWKDLEGYKEWLTHQDTPLSDIKKIKPELFGEGGGYNPYSYSFQGMPAAYKWLKQAKAMGQIIEKEPDLKIKGALLQSYHKHFGQKPTLSQSLASIMPKPPPELKSSSWDAFLQSHTTDQINASIKKMMKAEKDPERFVQLVDTWGKYLGGLSGIGAVTNMLGKGWQAGQPVPSKTLLQLYHWKKQGGPASSPVPDYWSIKDQEASPYIKNKQVIGDDSGYYAPYVGWTPPVAGSTGKADPAMMGSLGEPTYTAPEKATTKAYKELIDKVSGHQAAFSGPEKKTMASDEFQTWFNAQSSAYKKTFAHNPGIALDDYNAFMGGEVTSAEPPEGDGAAKFDLNPYHYAPKATGPNHVLMNPQGLKYKVPTPAGHPKYPGWTKNPIPSNGRPHVDWPDAPDPVSQYEDPETGQKYEIPQEEIPLPGGQHFEAPKQMHELHRGIRIRLDRDRLKRDNMLRPITDKNGQYQKDHDPLLEEIARIVHGSSDTTYPKEYGDLYNELGKHIQDKSGYVPESEIKKQPWGGGSPGGYAEPKKVFDFGQWMMKHQPPPEQLYELAKKWGIDHPEQYGVPPPGETPGSYTAPGLGNKLLDYLESSGYEETGHSPERYVPGFGNHWTQSTGTATSFGGGSTSYNELPVMITADWNGVGEDPNRTGTGNASGSLSAVSHPGETEITLAPGAPVKVKQVRIRPHVPVPQGKPWQASKLRNMAMYLFPHESSDFRNKWAADMEKDDAAHWYDQVVPWLKKNADWDNWVQNAPSGDWIEIPVDPHMREASLSAYERRIMALFEGIS